MTCEIKVIDRKGNPQAGVGVYINDPQLERWIEEWQKEGDRRDLSSSARGTTNASGAAWFNIPCEGEFKIYLNRKYKGMYLLDNGVSISITI